MSTKWKIVRRWIALSGVLAGLYSRAIGAEPPSISSAAVAPEWDQRFQRTSGWIGADGNYSLQVAPDRLLWFFSDTLVGRIENGRRVDTKMINNSVGVQSLSDANQPVEFFHGSGPGGEPASLLTPETAGRWYWPVGGVSLDGRVHLILWEFEKSTDPGVFGFRQTGGALATIENPLEPPDHWKVRRQPLSCFVINDTQQVQFGSAMLEHDGHVYIYGTRSTPQVKLSPRQMLLARVRRESITKPQTWEYRSASGWTDDLQQAVAITSGVATEYSVIGLADRQQFVTISHGDFLSSHIEARFAEQPWGPWSKPETVWTTLEPQAKPGAFTYSGKAHAALSTSNELLITYAVNSFEFGNLFSDPSLYWPRFVRVTWEPSSQKQ